MIKGKKSKIYAIIAAAVLTFTIVSPQMVALAAPVEVAQAALGIDVSRYQGQIDWDKVAASGIKFAIIRVGFRSQASGMFNEDPYARYNLQEANRVGIKVGAYFFSTAVNKAEVLEEANWVCDLLDSYQVTFPVAFDCEGYNSKSSRQYGMTKDARTELAMIYMNRVAERGYNPMFYSAKNQMDNNKYWDMTKIASKYKVWVASYPAVTFPNAVCNYTGIHSIWQYSEKGRVAGIEGDVDMNVSYFDYSEVAPAKSKNAAPVAVTTAANVQYTPVMEVVTTNNTVNLRTEPSTARTDTVVTKVTKGGMFWRVGVGNNGWSMVKLPDSDTVYYASTQYLVKVQ